ncbi:MAG: pyridoxamine 5'-phosphate oxidase family protein [Eubacteriales bacterium]|nr:pyridoxamine 5'-phosphate oxidase family protein [Eubacteriales bacterium]
MRRTDRQVTDMQALQQILDTCKVCRIAMADGDRPYLVPMNYGYRLAGGKLTLYFHCAHQGRKLDILKRNPRVCFEMDCEHALMPGDTACEYGYAYASIIGEGAARILTDEAEKIDALQRLMLHQTGQGQYSFPAAAVSGVTVFCIDTIGFTGKRR